MRIQRTAVVVFGAVLGVFAANPAPVFAEESKKLVAVLEFGNHAKLSTYEITTITDLVRKAARERLPSDKWVIMTRENLLKLLPPGTSLEKCNEAECEVDVGRQIGADYVVAGEAGKFGKVLQVKIKLYDTRTADLLSLEIAKADDIEGIEEPLKGAASATFLKLLDLKAEKASSDKGGVEDAGKPIAPAVAATPADEQKPDALQLKPVATGDIQKEHPYRWLGIGMFVAGGVAAIAGTTMVFLDKQAGDDYDSLVEKSKSQVVSGEELEQKRAEMDKYVVPSYVLVVVAAALAAGGLIPFFYSGNSGGPPSVGLAVGDESVRVVVAVGF